MSAILRRTTILAIVLTCTVCTVDPDDQAPVTSDDSGDTTDGAVIDSADLVADQNDITDADRTGDVDQDTAETGDDTGDVEEDETPLGCDSQPAGLGCECVEDSDCFDGLCVASGLGPVCATACDESCPDGYTCSEIDDDAIGSVCLDAHTMCQPCTQNADCESDENLCVSYGDERGSFCGGECEENADCPVGYLCQDGTDSDGEEVRVCIAEVGMCDCSQSAIDEGLFTICGLGECAIERTCTEDGLEICLPASGTDEVCDGLDNNCDGAIDEGFPDLDNDRIADCVDPDRDGDGEDNDGDNCPDAANPDQTDTDEDRIGDPCDFPTVPTLTRTEPESPAAENDIAVFGTGEIGSTVTLYTDSGCVEPIGSPHPIDGEEVFEIAVTVADDTTTTFYARAESVWGTESDCSSPGLEYQEISRDPDPPVLTSTKPASPGRSRLPATLGTAEPGMRIDVYAQADCAGDVVVSGTVETLIENGLEVETEVERNAVTVFSARAIDVLGGVSECSTPLEYEHDDLPPAQPTIEGIEPVGPSSNPNPTLAVSGDPDTAVQLYGDEVCRGTVLGFVVLDEFGEGEIEGVALPNQVTRFRVRGVDRAGNLTPCPIDGYVDYRHDGNPPEPVVNPAAVASTHVSLLVSWEPAPDDATARENMRYAVCAAETPVETGGCDDFVPTEFFTDAALRDPDSDRLVLDVRDVVGNERRFFQIFAVDEASNMSSSDEYLSAKAIGIYSKHRMHLGRHHSCVQMSDGTVQCWGANDSGQVLPGGDATELLPVRVALPRFTRSLALGESHTCAQDSLGGVICWGANNAGQLGVGDADSHDAPVTLGLTNVVGLSAGIDQTCALLVDGQVTCWGLGYGSTPVIVQESDSPLTNAISVQVWAGDPDVATGRACSVQADRTVRCWEAGAVPSATRPPGTGKALQVADDGNDLFTLNIDGTISSRTYGEDSSVDLGFENIVYMATGDQLLCGLTVNGESFCRGDDSDGALGDAQELGSVRGPVGVLGLSGPGVLGGLRSIAVGGRHACAMSTDSSTQCWGASDRGQLGRFDVSSIQPGTIGQLDAVEGGVQLALGTRSACGLNSNRSLTCWGDISPRPIDGFVYTASITAGDAHYCGVTMQGRVFCFGDNHLGQLGDGTTDEIEGSVDVDLMHMRMVDAAQGHTCAVSLEGALWCWGDNEAGQLGIGTFGLTPEQVGVALQVVGPDGLGFLTEVVDVVAGTAHTCALRQDGTVWCWGLNEFQQLGNGERTSSTSPVQVIGLDGSGLLEGVVSLESARNHTCARIAGSNLVCWGENNGEAITSDAEPDVSPRPIDGMSNPIGAAVGGGHSCYVASNGAVGCRGDNSRGQLGVSEGGSEVYFPTLPPSQEVACGQDYCCALAVDGTVRCWGENGSSQLGGVGTESLSDRPVINVIYP